MSDDGIVRFEKLSFPLKVGMVASWIVLLLMVIAFLVGFIGALV